MGAEDAPPPEFGVEGVVLPSETAVAPPQLAVITAMRIASA